MNKRLAISKLDFETENQFSGNIGKQTWTSLNTSNQAETRSFTYDYDNTNRLRSSVFSGLPNENYGLKDLSYDKNGNIAFVKRYCNIGSNFGMIDNLSYNYQGNKLIDVADAILGNANVKDFRAASSNFDYAYYSNGALKLDLNKGINNLTYNTYVIKISGVELTNNRTLNIVYDSEGELLKRTSSDGTIWENVRGYVFKNNALYASEIPEGRIVFENSQSHLEFNYRDIFGNLRVGFNGKNSTLSKVQQSDYDAFGWVFNETASTNKNLKKYQNQTRIEEFDLNLDIFKFRASDPTIGRLLNVDPLAEKYAYNSVYALQENKFGMGVELEGLELISFPLSSTSAIARPFTIPNTSALRVPIIPSGTTLAPMSSTQKHHVNPQALKNHPVIQEAKEGGFKQDGQENKMPLETYNKKTGKGQHGGSHPEYNKEVNKRLDNIMDENPIRTPEFSVDKVRNLVKDLKETISNNPSTKINDLFKLKSAITPSDNTSISPKVNINKVNPCAGDPNCV